MGKSPNVNIKINHNIGFSKLIEDAKNNVNVTNHNVQTNSFMNNIINQSSSLNKENIEEINLDSNKKKVRDLLYNDFQYGGNQIQPYYDFISGDNEYKNIIKKYFPNIKDDEVIDYLMGMNEVGCGYVAVANYIFESFADRPVEYEKTFGFPMYYTTPTGTTLSTVNYLFTDIYCYANKEDIVNGDNLFVSLITDFKDTIGRFTDSDNIKYSYEGSSGRNPATTVGKCIDIINSEKYQDSHIKVSKVKELLIPNKLEKFDQDIKQALKEGNIVNFTAHNYTLTPADSKNHKMLDAVPMVLKNAGHSMTITDINDKGEYIISSWGSKYVLDTDSVDALFSLNIVHFE